MKKASIFMTAAIVFLALAVLVVITTQPSFDLHQANIKETSEKQKSNIGSYAEILKRYAAHALRDSATKATYKAALEGAGNKYWINPGCNEAVPNVQKAKELIESYTVSFADRYLETPEGYEFGILSYNQTGKINKVELWVNDTGVYAGVFDEEFPVSGKFTLYEYAPDQTDERGGTPRVVSFDNEEESLFTHSYSTNVEPLRFWYMFRILTEWVNEIVDNNCDEFCIYGPEPVGGMVGPQQPFANINDRFDEYVQCDIELPPNVQDQGTGCFSTSDNSEDEFTLTCVDEKYQQPTEISGFKHLTFIVKFIV